MEITEGIHTGLTREQYDAIDAINATRLLGCRKSLAHGKEKEDNPPDKSAALSFGIALHVAFLEPEEFPLRYAVMPPFEQEIAKLRKDDETPMYKVPKATKLYRDQRNAWMDANADKSVVTRDEYDQIVRMGRALRDHGSARQLFSRNGADECTVVWSDEDTGARCKGRFDSMIEDEWPTIPDLKSTMDASPWGFSGDCAKWGYHIRGAFYIDGVAAFTSAPNLVFAAVEKDRPHAVGVYQLGERSIAVGRRIYKQLLKGYVKAQETGEWPAYSDQVEELEVPKWAWREGVEQREAVNV